MVVDDGSFFNMAHFLIHQDIFEDFDYVKEIIKSQGDSYTDVTDFKPTFHRESIVDQAKNLQVTHDMVIPFLPPALMHKLESTLNTGAPEDFFKYTNILSIFRDKMLNPDGVFLPYRCLYNPLHPVVQEMGDSIFIRPNEGHIIFDGGIIENKKDAVRKLKRDNKILDNELVYISKTISLKNEIRVFLSDNVVTWCYYGNYPDAEKPKLLDERIIEICKEISILIAENHGKREFVSVDFAVDTDDNVLVVEINNAYSSKFYKCDAMKIFQKSKATRTIRMDD